MKAFLAALFLLVPATVFGQTPDSVLGRLGINLDRPAAAAKPLSPDGEEGLSRGEASILNRVVSRFAKARIPIPQNVKIVWDSNPDVDGSADRRTNTIHISTGSASLPEDEFAFLLAHEAGHLNDPTPACENIRDHGQHTCEDNADWAAEQYMLMAGYSGYAGAGLFGRLMMMSNRASFPRQILVGIFDSHRSEVARTNNLLASWRAYCQRYGCR